MRGHRRRVAPFGYGDLAEFKDPLRLIEPDVYTVVIDYRPRDILTRGQVRNEMRRRGTR